MHNATQLLKYRPSIGSKTLSIIVGFYLVAFLNLTFWSKIQAYLAAYPATIWLLYPGILALFVALLIAISVQYLTKPAFIALILISAVSSWFMDHYGVVIDRDMIRNAVQTTSAEASGLITKAFLVHILTSAILPIILLLWVRVIHQPFWMKVRSNSLAVLCCLIAVVTIGFTQAKVISVAVRQHKDIVKSLNPVTPIISSITYFKDARGEAKLVVAPLGLDAKRISPNNAASKPRVTIIVAGETARAKDFCLNGYARDTNPETAKKDVIYYPNTQSCGTATATSLPCLFSQFTRSEYSHEKGLSNENVLDVLNHAGIDVKWMDNDSGSKGVADRIPYRDLSISTDPKICVDGECRDQIFIPQVEKWLNSITKDSVLVIHQIGSHGPSYYKRYTEAERVFTPDCQNPELSECTDEEVHNAYDNTIIATDHFLAQLITMLEEHSSSISPALFYVSDHGESLGEKGLYLHGTPYMFAPSEQTNVPMIVWMTNDFAESMGLNLSCLREDAKVGEKSHDNVFHSILSMMNVSTSAYLSALDIYAKCKT